MTYSELINEIAKATKKSRRLVRRILKCIPGILITMSEDETVRTPLGTFRMTKRAAKTLKPPKGKKMTIPEGLVVRLKSATRMRRAI
jgi:nucleoid DNA-binding protein